MKTGQVGMRLDANTVHVYIIAMSDRFADSTVYARNLRRLMVRAGLTLEQVASSAGVSERTVKALLRGSNKPHARTLNRLASGLAVSSDEFFEVPRMACASQCTPPAEAEIYRKVDRLLAAGQRELLAGLLDVLCREQGETRV